MVDGQQPHLTARQQVILASVVEEYVATGLPVGSKRLVEHAALDVSPSTVRYELAVLEEQGLLTHPHTSAGRVPTEAGYRFFVERLLDRLEPRPAGLDLDLSGVESQVDTALRATTEALADLTHLLALVSAPPLETTSVRHVEVLLLQSNVVLVVVITSTGGVTKRLCTFDGPVDPGLAEWAGQYLNERQIQARDFLGGGDDGGARRFGNGRRDPRTGWRWPRARPRTARPRTGSWRSRPPPRSAPGG